MGPWRIYILLYLWMSWFRVSSFSECCCSFSALDKRTCATHHHSRWSFAASSLWFGPQSTLHQAGPFSKPDGLWNLSFGKQRHFERNLTSEERKKCCKSKGFCNTARKSTCTSVLTKASKVIPYSVPVPGMKMALLVCTQAILFLPSFYLQAAVLTYPSSLSFPVPLEKPVVYQIVPKTVCFLKYSSRQMQCVLFLIRDAQIYVTLLKKIQVYF